LLKAHNHAFWVYGVIVGLAIREALVKVIAVPLSDSQAAIHSGWMAAVRLIVFLAMIIRFYLGSAIYFDDVYCSEGADQRYRTKNYGFDFLLGLIHFILFFSWSETIVDGARFAHGLCGFLVVLGVILLYDLLWWGINAKNSSAVKIRVWAILNALTFVFSYALLLFFNAFGWYSDKTNEVIAMVPVGLMTVADFGEMFSGRNVVTEKLVRLLGRSDNQESVV
jgi:hypothetical protein